MEIINWLLNNYWEFLALVSSVLYVYFCISQRLLTWVFGFFSGLFYIIVYYQARLYGLGFLQLYYIAMSLYGFYAWRHSAQSKLPKQDRKIAYSLSLKYVLYILLIGIASYFPIYYLLRDVIVSASPILDAITTIGSFIALYLMVKKNIDNWVLWIIINAISIVLYVQQELYLTALLFVYYEIAAWVGYFAWRPLLKQTKKRIAITGPEASGKSTLTARLAEAFQSPWVEEYARIYLEDKDDYDIKDVEKIIEIQIKNENKVVRNASRYVFCDTDPLVGKIWCEYKFHICPPSISRLFLRHRYDLYLLCKPDIPWEPDPLRENPDNRDELFDLYQAALKEAGFPYLVICGEGEARFCQAIEAVKGLE